MALLAASAARIAAWPGARHPAAGSPLARDDEGVLGLFDEPILPICNPAEHADVDADDQRRAVAGTPLAYALGRLSFRGKTWIELALDVPIVLPPLIAGIALLLAFGQNGIFGRFLATLGIRLPFTTAAVIFAQTFVAVPLYLRAARIGFGAVAPELREEATVEGANEWQVFRHVMLPVAWRALIAGLILCWTRGLGEFGATIVFAGNMEGRTQTIPLAIFVGFETNLDVALALSIVLVLLSIVVLMMLRWIDKAYSRSTTL